MSHTMRRGMPQRDSYLSKKLGTGAFKRINKDRRSKQVKSKKTTTERKTNNG